MSKFTEGPWALRGNNIGVVDVSETQSYGMLITIASVDEFDLASDWEANAALISAAPELYAALDELLKGLSDNFNADVYALLMLSMQSSSEVLAKARGET